MALVLAGGRVVSCGPLSEKPPRSHELAEDVRQLAAWGPGAPEDWRKLDPEEVLRRYELPAGPERALLARAVFVGTSQACLGGTCWAPSFSPTATRVDVGHMSRPVSALHRAGKKPPADALKAKRSGQPDIECFPRCHPLDAAARLASDAGGSHSVAIVRCTAMRDPRNDQAHHTHLKDDQLFLRTSYGRAFEKMAGDIAAPVGEALDEGGVIVTSGVGVLRGPIEEGALWLTEPPKVDIFWMAIEPRVQFGEEEDYAKAEDKTAVLCALDRAFAWAVAHGCDAVVLPPIGCELQGCRHPRLDVADAIFATAQRYGHLIPTVCVASDAPCHFQGGWWEPFAAACQGGRPPSESPPAVAKIPLPPYRLVPKDARAQAEKQKKLSARGPGSQGPRRPGARVVGAGAAR